MPMKPRLCPVQLWEVPVTVWIAHFTHAFETTVVSCTVVGGTGHCVDCTFYTFLCNNCCVLYSCGRYRSLCGLHILHMPMKPWLCPVQLWEVPVTVWTAHFTHAYETMVVSCTVVGGTGHCVDCTFYTCL